MLLPHGLGHLRAKRGRFRSQRDPGAQTTQSGPGRRRCGAHTTQPQASRAGALFPLPSLVGCTRQSPCPAVPMPCPWPGGVASDLVLHGGEESCPSGLSDPVRPAQEMRRWREASGRPGCDPRARGRAACVRAREVGNVHACTDGPQLLMHLTVHVCIIATLSMLTLPLNTCPLLGVPS